MTIDNTAFVIRNQKQRYLLVITLIVCVSIILFADFFSVPVAGIAREGYIAIVCCIYVVIISIRYFLDYNFISFSMKENAFSIKYYSLRNFGASRKNIEITFSSFEKYEIEYHFMGFKPKLYLFQRIKGQVAKYPPVSLSALSRSDIDKLSLTLNAISKK
jgi:hypothetical protein